MTIACAIYARISHDPNHDELGVRRQEADCRELAGKRGWEVAEVFVDDDRSAYSGKLRAGYRALLGAIEEGRVGSVVAWHPDRLHRSPRELEDFIDLLERSKCKVATVTAGDYDLATPAGRMTARVVGAVARGESEHKSARLRRKHLELAQAGKVGGGGTRPFGFTADRRHVDKREAKYVREAVSRFLAGDTLRSLCADFDRRGISTVTGSKWSPFVMRRMIGSPRIAGLRQLQGEVVGTAEWPAIVTPDDHRKVSAILNDPTRRKNRAVQRYLLAGIARCGLCDGKLVARPRSDKRRCYVCASGPGFHGCGKIRSLAEPLEELVAEAALHALDGPALASIRTDDRQGADDELAHVEDQLRELSELWGNGEITRKEWLAARAPLERRRDSALAGQADEARSVALGAFAASPGSLRKAWPKLGLDRQRAVLMAAIDKLTVGPAVKGRNTFDPSRVSIEWRA